MKFGNLEGTPRQIRDFMSNNGMKLEDYFVPPRKPVGRIWLFAAVLSYVITLGVLIMLPAPETTQKFLFVLLCIEGVWAGVAAHLRYEVKGTALISIFVFALLCALLAYGVLSPRELYDEVKQLRRKTE